MCGSRVISSNGAFLLVLLAAAIAGCHSPAHNCGPCNDIPPGAIPQPCGTYACQWINSEMARAEQDYFVIFQYEWAADPTKLSPFGQKHVAQLARRIDRVTFPIVIESSPDESVNLARQAAVLDALAKSQVMINPERVIVGQSEAEGLYGEEAPGIAEAMLASRGGGRGVGAGFSGTQSGTFGSSQGGFGTAQTTASGSLGSVGIGPGGY
jgi:hypothetical protein